MLNLMLGAVIGGAIGAWTGAKRRCETGACPLTSNPVMGGIYGALMGFLLVSTFSDPILVPQTAQEKTAMASTANGFVIELTTPVEFQKQVLEAQVPVLVDLWAPWCSPCRAQSPVVDRIAEQAGDKARVVKINVDEAGELAQQLNVSSIPTLLVFEGGRETGRMVGVQSARTLTQALGL